MYYKIRNLILVASLAVLAACSLPANVDEPPVALGDFRLGHNIVVVNNPEKGPFSRNAEDADWKEALTGAIAARFGSYDGDKFYHLGVKIDAYVLALPGVPLVFKPKSVLVLTVTMWDDAAGAKLNEDEKVLTIFEGVSAETLISSGLTRNKKQQMKVLSDNAAKAIQDWILENPEWIGLPPLSETQNDPEPVGESDEAISEAPIDEVATN